jgi:hypothetical protein
METSKIHDQFMIALKAAKNIILKNKTNLIKLRAPKQFCPFSNQLFCDKSSKYRTIDGSCNNLESTQLGKRLTPFKRLLTPAYDDLINSPRSRATNGQPLPNARRISIRYHEDTTDGTSNISNLGFNFIQNSTFLKIQF